MANEPERPIEKLLRATAKKRCDEAGPPLELHPATRRLLQGEVGRQYAKAEPEGGALFARPGQLWPRLAWGGGVLAVLAVVACLFVLHGGKGGRPALLARNEPAPAPGLIDELRPTPPAAPAEAFELPAPTAGASSSMVTLAEVTPPARRGLAPEVAMKSQPATKNDLASDTSAAFQENIAVVAAERPANRSKATQAEVPAATPMPTPASATIASRDAARPIGAVSLPTPTAPAPADPAAPSTVVMTTGGADAMAKDKAMPLDMDRSDTALAFKSPAAAPPGNAPMASAVPVDGRLISAPVFRRYALSMTATQWFAQESQSFATKSSLDDKVKPANPVLAAFQVEQEGRQLRIIDGDGSVYTGYFQPASTARRQPAANAESAVTARSSRGLGAAPEEKFAPGLYADQLMPQTYGFRVTGTNRSLKQKVVFTGNLLAATNAVLLQAATNDLREGGGLVGFGGNASQPGFLPLVNSRISGKVVVGNGKAVDINALPKKP